MIIGLFRWQPFRHANGVLRGVETQAFKDALYSTISGARQRSSAKQNSEKILEKRSSKAMNL